MTETKPDLLPWTYKINVGPNGEEKYANVYRDGELVSNLKIQHAIEICNAMNTRPTPSPDQVPGEVLKQSLHALNIAVRLRISDAYSQQEKHKMRVPIFEAITALEQHLKGEG